MKTLFLLFLICLWGVSYADMQTDVGGGNGKTVAKLSTLLGFPSPSQAVSADSLLLTTVKGQKVQVRKQVILEAFKSDLFKNGLDADKVSVVGSSIVLKNPKMKVENEWHPFNEYTGGGSHSVAICKTFGLEDIYTKVRENNGNETPVRVDWEGRFGAVLEDNYLVATTVSCKMPN